jgi:hypothetical protein
MECYFIFCKQSEGFRGARKDKVQNVPPPVPFYTQGAALRETHNLTVRRQSTVMSKTPTEPLRARTASPPSSDVFGTRWLSRTGHSEGKCWGEGEDATLRSRPSPSPLHQRKQDNEQTYPSPHTPPDEDLWRGRLILRPRPAWRPACDSAHCNRPCVAVARYGSNL